MAEPVSLYGPELVPENPQTAIVLLHGYGSDGEDLIQMAEAIRRFMPKQEETLAFFSPYAPNPTPYDMGYQWFEYEDIFRDLEGLEQSSHLLWQYIQHIHETHKLPFNRIFVLGFSQGTMTALFGAPRWPEAIGGVIGFSGRLLMAQDMSENMRKMPVALIHGEDDDVVDCEDSKQAESLLSALGYDVTCHTHPGLAHSIDVEGLQQATKFIEAHID